MLLQTYRQNYAVTRELNLLTPLIHLKQRRYRMLFASLTTLFLVALFPLQFASAFTFPQQSITPNNPYTDDLVIEHDDLLEGDVVVASGDVVIEEGGEVTGNLLVLSGDIEIEAGGRVDGDVASLSGDVEVAGKILGDLSVLSGDVELEESGSIAGDVSVLSGDVDLDGRDQVGGELRTGPNINIGSFFEVASEDFLPGDVEIPNSIEIEAVHQDRPSFFERFFGFVFRLIGAGVGMVVIAGGAGLLARSKPDYLESVRKRLQPKTAANFAAGALFNVVFGLLMVIFAIVFCLFPMSLISGGSLLAVNGIGWASISASVGRKLTGYTDAALPSVANVVLGALVLTAPFAFVWALDIGCLRFIAFLAAFGLSSLGAGAVLMPWIQRITSDDDDGRDGQDLLPHPS